MTNRGLRKPYEVILIRSVTKRSHATEMLCELPYTCNRCNFHDTIHAVFIQFLNVLMQSFS